MCSGNVCKCHRARIRKSAPVCLSNGITLGSREINDLIKISCLFFFLPPFMSLLSFFPPASSPPSSLPPASHLCSLACHSSQPLYACFHKGARWITAFTKMAAVHCSFCLRCAPRSVFPSGERCDLTVMERMDGGCITCCQKCRA